MTDNMKTILQNWRGYLLTEEYDHYIDARTGRKKKKIRPKTQKEMDKVFPGYADMKRLSRGILEKDKKKMKHCKPGNANHSADDGKFTSKDKAGSWSIRGQKKGRDCKIGTAQVKGGKELFTKVDCGRDGKHLCSDPSKLRKPYRAEVEEEIDNLLTSNNVEPEALQMILQELERIFNEEQLEEKSSDKNKKIKELCSRYGLRSFSEWVNVYLKRVNLAVKASKGDLYKNDKKKK